MISQIPLFEVPRRNRGGALREFKLRQGVWTWHTPDMKREDHPWSALLVPRARQRLAGYEKAAECDDPSELIWHFCAILDEWGLLTTGETERDAIERLCAANNMTPP